MNDRIPLYPGRVKMTPVAGQANTYDMVRADDPTQAGTPLNKATLLKDATAALYGLGTGAVPDDVLAELGKYKQYWWKRRTKTAITKYKLEKVGTGFGTVIVAYAPNGETNTFKLLDDVSVNEDTGEFVYNYSEYVWTSGSNSRPALKKVAFINESIDPQQNPIPNWDIISPGVIYFFDTNTSNSLTNSNTVVYFTSGLTNYKYVSTPYVDGYNYGDWEYLQSSTRSAYPDSGTQDGYEYEYLGIPFDNAVTAPKIETGSYVGTGTYGQANPNTLTFGFKPKFVWIYAYQDPKYPYWYNVGNCVGAFPFDAIPENTFGNRYPPYDASGPNNNSYSKRTGNTLTWYNTKSANEQFNGAFTYYYIAIG